MSKKYIAEFVGTFTLAFTVLAAVVATGPVPVAIPVIAGLVLGLFVYTIGSISGCHINPAVTIGLLSVKKITTKEAAIYVVVQVLAATLAVAMVKILGFSLPPALPNTLIGSIFVAEVLGASVFAFGIASIVYGKVSDVASGFVIGGSLLLGILVSSLGGAAGILNPAIAFALNSVSVTYLLAPVVGTIAGFQLYKYLVAGK